MCNLFSIEYYHKNLRITNNLEYELWAYYKIFPWYTWHVKTVNNSKIDFARTYL